MLLQTISSDSSINKVSSKGNIKIKSLQYNNIKQKLNSTQLVRSESISIMIYPNQHKIFPPTTFVWLYLQDYFKS